jgi:hypothetical protein
MEIRIYDVMLQHINMKSRPLSDRQSPRHVRLCHYNFCASFYCAVQPWWAQGQPQRITATQQPAVLNSHRAPVVCVSALHFSAPNGVTLSYPCTNSIATKPDSTSTQPLTEMSTGNFAGYEERTTHKADNLVAIYEPIV